MTATQILDRPITDASAWTRAEIEAGNDWVHVLTDAEVDDLDAALGAARQRVKHLTDITRADFPLPVLGAALDMVERAVRVGRGFFLLRGLPVTRYSDDDILLMKWGIGAHLGRAISQNVYGDMLGHVYDHGREDPTATRVRGYQTSAALNLHVDRADMTSLLCLRQGGSGGISRVVSSLSVHNALLAKYPEYLPPLYEGMPYIYIEEAGDMRTWKGPVFGMTDGVLSCSIRRDTVQKAIERSDVVMTALETAALRCFDNVVEDPALVFEMALEPGDIQFVNNYTVLHGRTAFTDDAAAGRKRHLVRLWLNFFTPRPASDYIRDQYKGIEKQLSRDHDGQGAG
jgi:hypothetical protein